MMQELTTQELDATPSDKSLVQSARPQVRLKGYWLARSNQDPQRCSGVAHSVAAER